jgi:hypothetical protein
MFPVIIVKGSVLKILDEKTAIISTQCEHNSNTINLKSNQTLNSLWHIVIIA